jgi:hypothetical protein
MSTGSLNGDQAAQAREGRGGGASARQRLVELARTVSSRQLPTCQTVLTPWPVIALFLVTGLLFTPLGVVLFLATDRIVEVAVRYDDACSPSALDGGAGCSAIELDVHVAEDMAAPVYVYYKLTNFFQNHRSYVSSRSDEQLSGHYGLFGGDESSASFATCEPLIANSEGRTYFPCGLIAWSTFNDSFSLAAPDGSVVPWTADGVAWPSDLRSKFVNPPFDVDGTRILKDGRIIPDFQSETFVNWMRVSAMPTFRKLHRIVPDDVAAGTYRLRIKNNFPTTLFDGQKWFVMTTSSWIGAKNPFLSYMYMVLGAVCLLLGLCFAVVQCVRPRRYADLSRLRYAPQTN